MKLGVIIQRYGPEVLGGSEHLARLVAERLAAQHEIEVLTTCARDYVTWRNDYPEGVDRIRGVTVRRFANERTRDLEAFNRYSNWIYNHSHSRDNFERQRHMNAVLAACVQELAIETARLRRELDRVAR